MLTLKLPPLGILALDERGDFPFGDNACLFLRLDWNLEKVLGFFKQLNEPYSALSLAYLGLNAWKTLEKLLPDSGKEVRAMHEKCQYSDCFTDRFCPSMLPLFVVTTDPSQYVDEPRGFGASAIERATLDEEALADALKRYTEGASAGATLAPGRIPQVLLGTGYSRSCLPSDGDSRLNWQFSGLSNGDVLVLAGYEWFNK